MTKEKTAFRTAKSLDARIDVHSDIDIVYGAGDKPDMTFEQSVNHNQDKFEPAAQTFYF